MLPGLATVAEGFLPRWLVVASVHGTEEEVRGALEPLAHMQPTVRASSNAVVFLTLLVTEIDACTAQMYAQTAVARALSRSVAVQSVVAAP